MAILKQLFVIAERKNHKKISASLKTAGVHFENAVMAHGTARSDLLSVLGLDSAEKVMITGTVRPEKVAFVMEMLKTNFDFGKGGGVAFTVPITAVSGPAALMIMTGGNV